VADLSFAPSPLVRARVLDLGLFDVGAPGAPVRRRIGIPGFLLETASGRRIAVDSGFDSLWATDPAAAEARDRLSSFGRLVDHGPQRTLAGQLALCGLGIADLDLLILTHSHIDHAGLLAGPLPCPVLLTAAERGAPRPLWWGGVQPVAWPEGRYLTITAETELVPGLTAIPTPGHTAGHLSLALDLPGAGAVILAGDAINRRSEPGEGFPDAEDPTAAAASAARLVARAAATGARLIWGHDPDQWPALPKAPQPLACPPPAAPPPRRRPPVTDALPAAMHGREPPPRPPSRAGTP
jgi:N-acyl homoserine lactone hydrolase